jgi:antitoxin component YwqK of YwqJK toxin-antitoxin module
LKEENIFTLKKMKKSLFKILLLSVILIGCSEERRPYDELVNKGTQKERLMYYDAALYNGVGFYVYSNGQLEIEANFKDGKEDGLVRMWYESGQLEFEGIFKDGKEDGLSRNWYENGQLKRETNYKDGEKEGLSREWYENGQLRKESYFKNGDLKSIKTWDEDGNLR